MRSEEYVKQYFYITIHFSPDYEGTVFAKHQDDLYTNATLTSPLQQLVNSGIIQLFPLG